MKVGILAGGVGSGLAEETEIRPKPMVEIGGRPILWHIMKYYASFDFNQFVIALGYKGEYIKRFMVDYCHLYNDVTVHQGQGRVEVQHGPRNAGKAELTAPGQAPNPGGPTPRHKPYLGS